MLQTFVYWRLPRTLRDYKHEEGLKGEGGNEQSVSIEQLAHLKQHL